MNRTEFVQFVSQMTRAMAISPIDARKNLDQIGMLGDAIKNRIDDGAEVVDLTTFADFLSMGNIRGAA